ncbi:MAG: HlyD family efflux transporter periplasmic adaptor subunit [Kineosporiaceae bacterium]|nr:HlyD family efflux transporter periplasmic adaptor subunit [Aeromicrobium sp.]
MTATKPEVALKLREEVFAQRSNRSGNDEPLRVDRPRSWILLSALGVIAVSLLIFGFVGQLPQKVAATGVLERVGDVTVQSVAEGQVRTLHVVEGENVDVGDPIVDLVGTDGHVNTVASTFSGRIAQLFASPGKVVFVGNDLFAMIRSDVPDSGDLFAYAFLTASDVNKVVPGMVVDVGPLGTSKYGVIVGTVDTVSDSPSSSANVGRLLRNSSLADQFVLTTQFFVARIRLEPDANNPDNPSGVKWTNSNGPPTRLLADTVVSVQIQQGTVRPIDLVFGN